MTERKPRPPKEKLEKLYWEEEKTLKEIGDIYDLSKSSINRIFKKYRINTRNPSERHKKKKWEIKEEWIQYGLYNGYDKKSPTEICKSKIPEERSWYEAGGFKDKDDKSWRTKFPFSRERIQGRWKTEEEWKEYGFEHGFDKRNPTSLSESEDKKEKSWYNKGMKLKDENDKTWASKFLFDRKEKPKGYWKNPKNFEKEMLQAIKENSGEFPTGPRLREMCKNGLRHAILNCYGGMDSVKERMGFDENDNVNHLEIILTNYIGEETA